MHPELIEVNPKTPSIIRTEGIPTTTAQHGFNSNSHESAHPIPHEEGRGEESPLPEDEHPFRQSDLSSSSDNAVQWMSSTGSPLNPYLPANLVREYEEVSSSSEKNDSRGSAFRVIARVKKFSDSSTPIAVVPNEVLTHILSYLEPPALSAVSLVSRKFHDLVITPHAWRTAFSRFFPSSDLLVNFVESRQSRCGGGEPVDLFRPERRCFTRLTALASWRSEYILRTRLLRSLARGKPAQQLQLPRSSAYSRSGLGHSGNATVTYSSQLFTTVNHLHATFGSGLNKRLPRFIHGTDEIGLASSSDPNNGKVDAWGLSDPQIFAQFSDQFPGDALWGLGSGAVVGVPNVMDVSQAFGMIYGEGLPGGSVYHRSVGEMKGRLLFPSFPLSIPELGIPKVEMAQEAICSVCIAKSTNIPTITEGVVGMMSGSSLGVVTAYSLGTDGIHDQRLGRGEVTARWVLSPGIPIIAIVMDDSYNSKRHARGRIWAVALNALGEVFHLANIPTRHVERGSKLEDEMIYRLAWATARSVHWNLVEPTRRVAKIDPYADFDVDGSYSPRSSWTGMGLSAGQIISENREIETFLEYKPRHFQKVCTSWNMRRQLEVDFARDDGTCAGEAIVVIDCGLDEGASAGIRRYTRYVFTQVDEEFTPFERTVSPSTSPPAQTSLFTGSAPWSETGNSTPIRASPFRDASEHSIIPQSPTLKIEEWRTSNFTLGGYRSVQITATAMDNSTYACLTATEDPLLSMSGLSTASSPMASPLQRTGQSPSRSDIPGQRGRFLAVGTKSGAVMIWNIRATASSGTDIINDITPVRVIHTDSPQISSLAMSALYLVHGGNDGLVQTWDVLASDTRPIRTLNSRFSSRARRRLMQAEASIHGVGVNLFAAGAICLDPDPTVLCGMVSLGTHLFYWSYSASAADQYKGKKRNLRRSHRGSNHGGERFAGTGRGSLKEYIANEKLELENQKRVSKREAERLTGRFGVDLLGKDASEAEILAYATMLSEESLAQDVERRQSESSQGSISDKVWHRGSVISDDSMTGQSLAGLLDEREDDDASIAEAIRLSLLNGDDPGLQASSVTRNASIKYTEGRQRPSSPSPPTSNTGRGSSQPTLEADLDFALQLSLAEEQSRNDIFPTLVGSHSSTSSAKGKGKRRAS
ncbi:MAG: hypothetical protein M1812_000656 [Candelaria pacifica]|nr:MAG: hypothetical protein M1812_000656 [Candelaria pacifica]